MRCPTCQRRLSATGCPRHPEAARRAVEPSASSLGFAVELPDFEALEVLAAGGSSVVFGATRRVDGARVVLKVARSRGDEQFDLEARMLDVLEGLAPRALGQERVEGRSCLVMERLSGQTLAQWLADRRQQSAGFVDELRVFEGVAAVVDGLHARGVIHRDLKPENLFLKDDGGVVLLDFGLALRVGEVPAGADRPGSVEYMSPEQCAGLPVGPSADLYAAAIILFELVCGRPPYVGAAAEVEQAHVSQRVPRLSQWAQVPLACDVLFSRALSKTPSERFESASALARAFETALREPLPRSTRSLQGRARSTLQTEGATLIAVTGRPPEPDVARALGLEAQLVLRREGLVLLAMLGERAHAVRAALRAARSLPGWVERVVIHCADVRVRKSVRRSTLAGEAIDRVSEWNQGTERVLLTRAAAARIDPSATRALGDAFVPRTDDEQLPPVEHWAQYGREPLLTELERLTSTRLPHLATVVGDTGLGKTRLLLELRQRLPAALCWFGRQRDLLLTALEQVLGVSPAMSLDEVRGAIEAGLDAEVVAQAALALGVTLGTRGVEGAELDLLRATPGAIRHLVALAIASGLKRRAAVLLLDDAPFADPTILDALEIVTADGGASVLVVVTAPPGLTSQRPNWGARAVEGSSHELGPLPIGDARLLLSELLQPVEHTADDVLGHIIATTQGIPLYLVEFVNSLRVQGGVRRAPGRAWQVIASDVLSVSKAGIGHQLARRNLERLTPALREFAQLAAIVADPLDVVELRELQRVLDGRGHRQRLDAGVGLVRLAAAGLLRATSSGAFEFRHPLLRDAVEELTPPEFRRELHRTAAHWLQQRPDAPLHRERLARHSEGAGDAEAAARLALMLGRDALRRHQYTAADQWCSKAIAQARDQWVRADALHMRGRARLGFNQLHESLSDLREAFGLKQATGRDAVELLLEQATVLDWLEDWAGAEHVVAMACECSPKPLEPALNARLLTATGRTALRRESFDEAVVQFRAGIEEARRADDRDAEIQAMLQLPHALTHMGRLEDPERFAVAQQLFEEVIQLCQRTGDRVHLGAALANRILVWQGKDPERAEADIRKASAIARELGHAQMERVTQFNLAEHVLAHGSVEEALQSARRSRLLQARLFSEPSPDDSLLLARIHLVREECPLARELLDWSRMQCPEKTWLASTRLLARMVELRVTALPAESAEQRCEHLITDASAAGFTADALAEVLWNAARACDATGLPSLVERYVSKGQALAGVGAQWSSRLQAVSARLAR